MYGLHPERAHPSTLSSPRFGKQSMPKGSILVIDDESEIREGLEMLQRFPDVDAIVFDTALRDVTCEQFTREIKKQKPKCRIIGLKHRNDPQENQKCGYKTIFGDDPAGLLKMLEEEFGGRHES